MRNNLLWAIGLTSLATACGAGEGSTTNADPTSSSTQTATAQAAPRGSRELLRVVPRDASIVVRLPEALDGLSDADAKSLTALADGWQGVVTTLGALDPKAVADTRAAVDAAVVFTGGAYQSSTCVALRLGGTLDASTLFRGPAVHEAGVKTWTAGTHASGDFFAWWIAPQRTLLVCDDQAWLDAAKAAAAGEAPSVSTDWGGTFRVSLKGATPQNPTMLDAFSQLRERLQWANESAEMHAELMLVEELAHAAAAAYTRNKRFCGAAISVPKDVPKGTRYTPTKADFDTGSDSEGWRCLQFKLETPMRARLSYRPTHEYDADGFEVVVELDRDGDGKTSTLRMLGIARDGSVRVTSEVQILDGNE
ncbi:MAG: hypothetical protein U0271_18215 [Polyangiaceae bacterium]